MPASATSTGGPAWTRVAAPQLAIGGGATTTLTGAVAPAAAGDLWVVVGTRLAGDGTGQATVFTSPDATSWTVTPLTGDGVTSEAAAVTTYNGTTTVVGSVGSGSDRRAAVWTAPSASSAFTEVPDQAAFEEAGAGVRVDAVAAGAIGVIATGTAAGAPAVWYSTDDRHFTRDTAAEKVIGASPAAVVRSLVVDNDGVFAAGSSGSGSAMQAMVWTSSDGIDFKAERSPQGVFTGGGAHEITGMVTVAHDAARLTLAVGAVDTGAGWSPASWLSLDGHDWSTPSLSFPVVRPPAATSLPGGVTAEAVAATPTGFVAVGGAVGDPMAWTSADGRSWQPVTLPAPTATATWLPDLVAANATTTLLGDRQPGDAHLLTDGPHGWQQPTTDASTWGTPAAVATPVSLHAGAHGLSLVVDVRRPSQALGPASDDVEELTSADGAAWQAVPVPEFAGARLLGSSASPGGATVVTGVAGGGGAAFGSVDGASWQPLALGSGLAVASAAGVLPDGRALVAGTGPLPGASAAPLALVAGPASGAAAAPAVSPLDPGDPLVSAQPLGACATEVIEAVVGASATAGGVAPVASVSSDGRSWQPATVATTGGAQGGGAMRGCVGQGGALVAWGEATGASGAPQPALWSSTDGRSWATQGIAAFDAAAAGSGAPALDALATSGTAWLAVGGATTAPSTAPGAGVGLWSSGDGGRSFSRVDTAAAPFAATGSESLVAATWLGSTAVVAGTVDGRLAVFSTPGS